MLISELLNEIRRNPELNPNINYVDQLYNIAQKRRNAFVTYTYHNKIGIYPKSVYSTPLGIYAYPINYVIEVQGKVPFPEDPNFAKVFSPVGNIIYLSKVTFDVAEQYINKAKQLLKRYDIRDEELRQIDVRYKVWEGGPPKYLWYKLYALCELLSKHINRPVHLVSRSIWVALGVDGVVDDEGQEIIHEFEPTQAVFFKVAKLIEIETFYLKFNKESLKDWDKINVGFEIAAEFRNSRDFDLEKDFIYMIKKYPDNLRRLHLQSLFEYIKKYLKRWPAIESYLIPYFKKNPKLAYFYAKDLLEGRWKEGEEYILNNIEDAFLYARNVINKNKSLPNMIRWPELEDKIYEAIKTTKPTATYNPAFVAYDYARDIIGKRWEEVEPYIMTDPYSAYKYARDLIGKRWKEAEPYIMQSPAMAASYADEVINKKKTSNHIRWKEAEPIIMTDPISAYNYAVDVLGHRWEEAEPTIQNERWYWIKYKTAFGIE